jgi:23S rRNA (adenine2503-C2)-methyltransferase
MTEGTGRPDLVPLLPEELSERLAPLGEPAYRGRQVFGWIHGRRETAFERMTDLPNGLRTWLADHHSVSVLAPTSVRDASDGTRKLLFALPEGGRFEAVLMPSDDRVTLCISSQAGCRMGCAFCLTGRLRFARSLTAAEIAGQVLAATRLLPPGRRISNVVFMGMGEPLDNLPEVRRAVRLITHREGLAVAPRRTTISTVGLVPQLREWLESGIRSSVAISLCATTDEARAAVVPIGRRHPIGELVDLLRAIPPPHGHRYTVEYQLIRGLGDSLADAQRLSAFLARFPSKVNLIPFNPWPGSPFSEPLPGAVEAFRRFLEDRNHLVTIRVSRGRDIGAACGQLDGDPEPIPACPEDVA